MKYFSYINLSLPKHNLFNIQNLSIIMIKKGSTVFYLVMIALFMYILFYFKDSDHFIGALAFILSVTCLCLADKLFKLKFKSYHYAILIFMATVGVLLSPIYFIFAAYDKILHFSFPFLGCFLVFYLVNKLDMDFKTKVFFTFTIMITLITFEEIVEFLLDWFFDSSTCIIRPRAPK
jgi:hypothetical protein